MNAVEIEQAVTELAEQPFDPVEFPYAFLAAFGNKETTLKRLRTGATNKSDVGGVLQTNNIHILTCAPGQVGQALARLRASSLSAVFGPRLAGGARSGRVAAAWAYHVERASSHAEHTRLTPYTRPVPSDVAALISATSSRPKGGRLSTCGSRRAAVRSASSSRPAPP